jgi:hypothetical protein
MRRLNIILAGLLASCSTFASTGTATSRTALLLIISVSASHRETSFDEGVYGLTTPNGKTPSTAFFPFRRRVAQNIYNNVAITVTYFVKSVPM